ncbi:MAG: deoxyribose-phosphate aldolase [Candidatus Marinimicrobia bacterium]|nr:deoxyribose-phosphate aldolase [Candidatus Neomarinimicrobiota bacterium]|tara:strand:- start:6678 stop:7574 length:897 start_codon:yes stop_codon:yes gene_type:complete
MSQNKLYIHPVDQINIQERVSRLLSRSIKNKSKIQALKLTLSMIDLTTLEGKDSPGKVKQLCYKATHLYDKLPGLPNAAAICVYPNMVSVAKKALAGTKINIASVATSFPSGMADLNTKLVEVKSAVESGANEIDMVISRGSFLRGEYNYVFDEINCVKEACGKAQLKVILETGELVTLDNVRFASEIAMEAGADFIKTSTGKISPSATPSVVLTMLEAIRDFEIKTGKKIGMKPAGGISKAKQAIQYLVMVKETLGEEWLSPELFRFGASSLANDVLMQIIKQHTGQYQSIDYFSID